MVRWIIVGILIVAVLGFSWFYMRPASVQHAVQEMSKSEPFKEARDAEDMLASKSKPSAVAKASAKTVTATATARKGDAVAKATATITLGPPAAKTPVAKKIVISTTKKEEPCPPVAVAPPPPDPVKETCLIPPVEPTPPNRPCLYGGPGLIGRVQNGLWIVETISTERGIIERAENSQEGIVIERICGITERISDSGRGLVIERIRTSNGIEERVRDNPRQLIVQRFDDGTVVVERLRDFSRTKAANDVILNREERKDSSERRIANPKPPNAPKYRGAPVPVRRDPPPYSSSQLSYSLQGAPYGGY